MAGFAQKFNFKPMWAAAKSMKIIAFTNKNLTQECHIVIGNRDLESTKGHWAVFPILSR